MPHFKIQTALAIEVRMPSTSILGPFIGHTTDSSTKIWLRNTDSSKAYVQLYKGGVSVSSKPVEIQFNKENLWSGIATFENLSPDTTYSYQVFSDSDCANKVPLDGLSETDLVVTTMPRDFDWNRYRYDFLLLSCNNPDQSADYSKGRDGYEVWKTMPAILKAHEGDNREARVLFALMGGDQVYADDWRKRLLESTSEDEKVKIYFEVYEHYWSDSRYKKVLCKLPAYLMWDDHDIMDGWGSETSSFIDDPKTGITTKFRPEWQSMFMAAKRAFKFYQASRNPSALTAQTDIAAETFDVGFKVGPLGFILADLRSNRNWQAKVFWTEEQISAVENWIQQNRKDIEVLFFLTPVVVAHGSPLIEEGLVKNWDLVMKFFKHARSSQTSVTKRGISCLKWITAIVILAPILALASGIIFDLLFLQVLSLIAIILLPTLFVIFVRRIKREDLVKQLELIKNNRGGETWVGWLLHIIGLFLSPDIIDSFDNKAGDLSDDIRDSWGAEGNEKSTERLLQMLFDLQNDVQDETRVHVAILSGDIHAGGYSNIYSSKDIHKIRPVIPHIVSSPVGYSPFPWIAEAFYRKFSLGSVTLGNSNSYYAQNSHHYTERNIAICSTRRIDQDTLILKTKFYVEGFHEPQTNIFDLETTSHRESIKWS